MHDFVFDKSTAPDLEEREPCRFAGCDTLQLTRLLLVPRQYQRRSVEGLSILLFVFAFMGNATYVGSILLNPGGEGASDGGKMSDEERAFYLLEALP